MRDSDTLPLSHDRVPSPVAVPLSERLTWTLAELAALTGISLRHLRRLDSDRHIPGRLTVGRRVLFTAATIREWVREGMPGRERWQALQRAGAAAKNRAAGPLERGGA
jgi:excisionase family DNA binding protein